MRGELMMALGRRLLLAAIAPLAAATTLAAQVPSPVRAEATRAELEAIAAHPTKGMSAADLAAIQSRLAQRRLRGRRPDPDPGAGRDHPEQHLHRRGEPHDRTPVPSAAFARRRASLGVGFGRPRVHRALYPRPRGHRAGAHSAWGARWRGQAGVLRRAGPEPPERSRHGGGGHGGDGTDGQDDRLPRQYRGARPEGRERGDHERYDARPAQPPERRQPASWHGQGERRADQGPDHHRPPRDSDHDLHHHRDCGQTRMDAWDSR